MSCSCHGNKASDAVSGVPGTRIPTSRTITIAPGKVADLVDTDLNRRSILIYNQAYNAVVVAFGNEAPVDGNGAGTNVPALGTLSVETTAAVHVLNPSATTPAVVSFVAESD